MNAQNPDWVWALQVLAEALTHNPQQYTKDQLKHLGLTQTASKAGATEQTRQKFNGGFSTALKKLHTMGWVKQGNSDQLFRATPLLNEWMACNSVQSLHQSSIDKLGSQHQQGASPGRQKPQTVASSTQTPPVTVSIPWAQEPQVLKTTKNNTAYPDATGLGAGWPPQHQADTNQVQPGDATGRPLSPSLQQHRQAQAPKTSQFMRTFSDRMRELTVAQLNDFLDRISPTQFEILCGHLLEKLGYGSATVTGGANDGGIDGIVSADPCSIDAVAYQAKHHRGNKKITQVHIQQFIGAIETYPGHRFKAAFFITTSGFHEGALITASRAPLPVKLIDRATLINYMMDYGLGLTARTVTVYELDETYLT